MRRPKLHCEVVSKPKLRSEIASLLHPDNFPLIPFTSEHIQCCQHGRGETYKIREFEAIRSDLGAFVGIARSLKDSAQDVSGPVLGGIWGLRSTIVRSSVLHLGPALIR